MCSRMLMAMLCLGTGITLVSGDETTTPWKVDRSKSSQDWTETSSWQNGAVPSSDGTANVTFGSSDEEEQKIKLPGLVDVKTLSFSNGSVYSFESVSTSASISIRDYIELLTGKLETEVYFNPDISLNVASDLEIKVGADTELEFEGTINASSSRTITVTGTGGLLLGANNSDSLNGRIKVVNGTLGLSDGDAAGNATIQLGETTATTATATADSTTTDLVVSVSATTTTNKPKLAAVDGDRTISNSVEVHGYLGTVRDDDDDHELNLSGTVSLTADTRIENEGGLLSFRGNVTETNSGVKVTVDADNPVLFAGTTSFTGGLFVEKGPVIFADLDALPASPTSSAFTSNYSDTYLGLLIDNASDRSAAVAKFLSQIDPTNFLGTIGFDTEPTNSTAINTYSNAIDLSNTAVRQIGSVTKAELTGTITPKANTNYTFGNGGGTLLIGSLLTNDNINEFTRGIHVQSDKGDPLTVFINNGANSFGGRASAQQSALVFGSAAGTLPTDASLKLFEGGYIGIQDTSRSVSAYLGQYDTDIATGVIGFDSQDRDTNRSITDAIDLSRFTATSPEFYLGSSTYVTLSGAITLPSSSTEYRFAGYKGGRINITSVLADATSATRSVRIGDQEVNATTGHRFAGSEDDVFSGVRLGAVNTYSGGTTLEAGQLVVNNNASIGTGNLAIPGDDQSIFDALENSSENGDDILGKAGIFRTDAAGLNFSNEINVKGFLAVQVPIDDGDHNLTLSGAISGGGGVIKQESGTLNLTGDNSSLTGGFFMDGGTLNVAHDKALGTGALGVGTESGTTINFNSSSPTIGGIYQADDEDDESTSTGPTINLRGGTTLTLNLVDDFEYGGTISGDGGLELTGSGTQELSGHNTYNGTTKVGSGAVLSASSGNSLGSTSSVTLDGGSLLITNDPDNAAGQFQATVSFGTNGGEIQGNGTLKFSSTLNIGNKASISAGESIGQLTFEGPVQFGELGKLKVEIGNGSSSSEIIADSVLVSSLSITSTSSNPFSINLTGDDGNLPSNFSDATSRTWTIVKSSSTISTFDTSKFNLDIASNLRTASGQGQWSLALGTSGTDSTNNAIFLSFTPVPEPSTFLLFGLGTLLVGFRAGRRRRNTR